MNEINGVFWGRDTAIFGGVRHGTALPDTRTRPDGHHVRAQPLGDGGDFDRQRRQPMSAFRAKLT